MQYTKLRSSFGIYIFRKAPITFYFFLAYFFTWIFHLSIPLLGIEFSVSFSNPAVYLYLIGLLGPLLSSVFVETKVNGKAGLKKLLKSGTKWKFSLKWYAFAILSVPILMFINIALNTGEFPVKKEYLNFSLIPLVAQIWIVVGEEYGWRGFALPRLQKRWGTIGASILLGLLWACWHLPLFFIIGSPQYTSVFLEDFFNYLLILIFWSLIMTMLFNRSKGSVLICFIFHAFVNFSAWIIVGPVEQDFMLYLYLPLVLISIYLMPRPFFKR